MGDNSSNLTAADPAYLFVYGTLRTGSRNSRFDLLMPGTRPAGAGRTRGQMIDLGAYPGLVITATGRAWVHGDLHALIDAPAVLERLDLYEGCSPDQHATGGFERVVVNVVTARSTQRQAWTYVYRGAVSGHPRIASGDYLAPDGRRK
ncbi:MAG: gamma-glutamylcyclotransferase [Gammaproteobacteria bacterium]|nr:gamma-glutamylcyclotransferase [Gammaproteobacteria bacterium]